LLNIKAFPIETYLKFGTLAAPDERLLIALFHNENEHYKKHLSEIKDIDKEVIGWLKAAYDNAG
jgi:hypothetical protein